MKLTFDRLDLKPEHRDISCSKVEFQHLNEEAQAALMVVKRGTFYNYERDNYNAVYVHQRKDQIK